MSLPLDIKTQTATAQFWDDSYSTKLLRVKLLSIPGMSLLDKARMMALYSMVSQDGSLVLARGKNLYKFWRSVTAIRNGDKDGNPLTERDATWMPLGPGSHTGEYPCGHCFDGARYLYGLPRILGGELEGGFDIEDPKGGKRHFDTFKAMAEEEAISRIWLGAHYSGSSDETFKMTKKIADHILDRYLLPVRK